VQLGDTSGTQNAWLSINGAWTLGRDIAVRGGSTGFKSITGTNAATTTATISGNIAMSDNLYPNSTTVWRILDLSGTVSGTKAIGHHYNAGAVGPSARFSFSGKQLLQPAASR